MSAPSRPDGPVSATPPPETSTKPRPAAASSPAPVPVKMARPAGVTIVAIWQWLIAGLLSLIGVGMLSGLPFGRRRLSLFDNDFDSVVALPTDLGVLPLVLFGVLALIATLLIFAGRGLWRLENNWRKATIQLSAYTVLINLLGLFSSDAERRGSGPIIGSVISIAIIIYLSLPPVRARFR